MPARTLEVVIIGDSASAQRAFAKTGVAAGLAAKEADKASTSFERTGARMSTLGGKVSGVGKTLTTHLTLPLLAVGGVAAKMSLDFNRSMLSVSTQAGGTAKEVKKLSAEILDLSAKGRFAQGPQELSEALFHIESTGYRGAKAMKVLKAASDLATVGNADLESTTNALVGAMKTGITGATDMREAIGILNASIGAGNLKMEDLNGAIGTGFLARAKAVGLTLQDAGAALGELTSQAVPANSAATRLSMTFSLLANPTSKAQGVLKGLGLDAESLAKAFHKPDGLVSALELLQEHLNGMTQIEQSQALSEAFGGAKSGGTIIALLNNVDDLNKKYVEIGNNAGTFNDKLKETNAEESVKLDKAWSGIRSSMIQLGNELLPLVGPQIREVGEDIVGVAHAFSSLPESTQAWIIKAGLAVAALGPLLTIGGNLLKVYGGVAKAVGKVGEALGIVQAEQAAGAVGAASGSSPVATTAAASALGSRSFVTSAGAAEAAAASEAAAGGAFGEKAALAGSGLLTGVTASGAIGAKLAKFGTVIGGLAGGYFAAEFGAQAIEGITGADLLENQDLKTSLTHGFNTSNVASTERRALAQVSAREQGIHPRLALRTVELKGLEASFHQSMQSLAADSAAGLRVVNADLSSGLEIADQVWSKGTKQWRSHTVAAMEGAVASIRRGMRDGTVNAETGQKEINRLLERIHLTKGDDPFGLASATAKSFKEAHAITASGVNAWAAQLAQMPVAARKSSVESTNKMLAAWADGHPKIEHEIESLSRFEITHFGATNKQLREGVRKGATGPVAEAFAEAAGGVAGALSNIGTNTNAMLKALGLDSMVEFQALVLGPSRLEHGAGPAQSASRHHHEAPGSYHGKGSQHKAGGGSITRVPGSGVQDTVPLRVNGEMSAIVAPGEDLAAINRHQRPLLDYAVSSVYGVNGLWDFFDKFDRPHYLAGGGEVKVKGPGAIGAIGHGALAMAVRGANEYIASHRPRLTPESGGSGVSGYAGPPASMKQLGDNAWVDSHTLAVTAYMDKLFGLTMSSGFRSVQHNAEIGGAPGSLHTHGSSSNPGATDSVGARMPEGLAWAKSHIAGLEEAMIDNYAGLGDNLHLGFFAKGGAVLARDRSGVTIVHPKWEPRFQKWMKGVWSRAKGLYGASGPAPNLFLARGLRGEMGLAGLEQAGTVEMAPGYARGAMEAPNSYGRGTLLHEWAHAFQAPGVISGPRWQREGGATMFERWAAPIVFPGYSDKRWPTGYRQFGERVEAEKGWDWIKRGQFKGYAKGGKVDKGPWAGSSIDHAYPESDGYTGTALPPYVIEALAEWAGLPGVTMFQITEGESMGHPGMDISDPPGRSRGLYAINDHYNPQFSATDMRNPVLNTLAAAEIVGGGLPNSGIWHGSSHVTGWDKHYAGDPASIARHVGGGSGGGSGKSKAPKYPAGHTGKGGGTYGAPAGPVKPGSAKFSPSEPPQSLKPGIVPKVLQGIGMQHIEPLFRAPGMSAEEKFAASEHALEIAEETSNNPFDDQAVYKYQLGVSQHRKQAIQKQLNKINKELGAKAITKKHQKELLAKRASLNEELGTIQGRISSARQGLAGEGEEATDPLQEAIEKQTEAIEAQRQEEEEHKQAVKEMTKAIKEQIVLQQQVEGVSSSTFLKAFADLQSHMLGSRTQQRSALAGNGSIGTIGSF